MSTYLRVLSHLDSSNEALSVPEIAADLKLSTATVRLAIKELAESGRVQRLGTSSTNARCYGITTNGRDALAGLETNR